MRTPPSQAVAPVLLADPCALGEAVVEGRVGLDDALIGAWEDRACKQGVFRCSFDEAKRRRAVGINGNPGRFWVQCNPGRGARRKPDQRFTSVIAPFDDSAFHFAPDRINEQEVLMRLRLQAVSVDILVNVSPLAAAHCLLVIDPTAHRAQVLDDVGLGAAIGIARMSQRADFKVAFNSLSACASVNHYHFHGLYFRGEGVDDDLMPSERSALGAPEIQPGLREVLDYPARGWCITPQVRGGLVRAAAAIATVLQKRDIPHNVVLSKQRVVVIPRMHQGRVPEGVFPGMAFLEVHGEMLVVGDSKQQAEQLDRAMTDEEVARQIGAIGLGIGQFSGLSAEVVSAIARL